VQLDPCCNLIYIIYFSGTTFIAFLVICEFRNVVFVEVSPEDDPSGLEHAGIMNYVNEIHWLCYA
jgi:hypothetical protein